MESDALGDYMSRRKSKDIWEFGDFQTPYNLAEKALAIIKSNNICPQTIIEPTCGKGSFLIASHSIFPTAQKILGVDINPTYTAFIKKEIEKKELRNNFEVITNDFFTLDWSSILQDAHEPILIVGNPPWVTSSELGLLNSENLPDKSNFQGHSGYDAITGKSNFDISEWMLLKYIEWLENRKGYVAVLCKVAVARKVLIYAWKHNIKITSSSLYRIDAKKHFNAAVDACFFIFEVGDQINYDCYLYDDLDSKVPSKTLGYHDQLVISDVKMYERWEHLKGNDSAYIWRSGLKHDCSKVMELENKGDVFVNGLNEDIILEHDYMYPLYKSSDIGNHVTRSFRKYVLVTQQYVGEETDTIKYRAPNTWRYLEQHEEQLTKRRSSIYKDKPRFAIFGVGDYTFSPWKVVISGFYKNLNFKVIGPANDKPAIVDDTVYFLPCWSESEAVFLHELLMSKPAQEYLESLIFWADKRPVTINLLKRLNIHALSLELGREKEYKKYSNKRTQNMNESIYGQLSLGISEKKVAYTKMPNKAVQLKSNQQG